MISCIIIDDEPYSIETIQNYILKVPELELLAAFNEPLAALNYIKTQKKPDIVFLDVDMPEMSGFELAGFLPPDVAIIYVTAFAQYALKAFETNVYDFLVKPVSYAKFLKSINKIQQVLGPKEQVAPEQENNNYIFINPGVKGKMIKIDYNDIIYIQGLKNYVVIYVTTEKYITYLTMKELEEVLISSHFLRIHKSYIINVNKIKSIEGNTVILSEHLKLPLGSNYKDILMNYIAKRSVISKR